MRETTRELAKRAGLVSSRILYGKWLAYDDSLETFRALIVHDATVAAMEKCIEIACPGSATDDISDAYHRGYMFACRGIQAGIRAEIPLPPENKP